MPTLVSPSLYGVPADLPTPATVMTGHVALVVDVGSGIGKIEKNTGSAWVDWPLSLSLAAGTVALTALALGPPLPGVPAVPGQALIMNPGGTSWAPSVGGHNDFIDRNILTTGTLSVGATTAKVVVQPLVGSPTIAAIYMGGVTASATNYALTSNGTQTVLNGHAGAGIGVSLALDGLPVVQVQSANVLNFWSAVSNPIFRQDAKTDDTTPQDLTIRSQGPWASATTQAKRTPGNLVYDIAAPVGDGLVGRHIFQVSGTQVATVQQLIGTPSFGTIYLGNITPGANNWAVTGDGGAGTVSSLNGGIGVTLCEAGITRLYVGHGLARFGNLEAFTITQLAPISDVTPFDLTMRSMAPWSSATVHQNPGNLVFDIAAPVGAGATGFHKFQISGSDRFVLGLASGFPAIWGAGVSPSASNFVLGVSNAAKDVVLNAPDATGGGIHFNIAGTFVANLRTSGTNVGFTFGTDRAYTITQQIQGSDTPTFDLSILGQAPFASASGANRNSASVTIGTTAPVVGGTAGSVFLKPNATTALEAAASGVITLPHYTTAGILHNSATTGVVSSSLIVGADFSSAGFGVGQAFAWNGTTFVPTSFGSGSGTVTGVTAGAGLAGGGSSGSVTLDVNVDGTSIVIVSDVVKVGLVPIANGGTGVTALAAGLLHSNGTVVGVIADPTSATGKALIWGGTAWSASTDFAAQNITTTGNLGLGAAATNNKLYLNSGASPANSQLLVQANSLGAISLTSQAPDSAAIGFDATYQAGAFIARDTSIALWFKTGAKMALYGSTGNTVGSAATLTQHLSVDLNTGQLRLHDYTAPGVLHNIGVTGVVATSLIVDADVNDVDWVKISGRPTDLAGYGIGDAVPVGRTLTGAGAIQIAGVNTAVDLSINRTISVFSATGSQLGVLELNHDLGGSATAPAVVNISGNGSLALVRCSEFLWDATLFPFLNQTISLSGSGRLMTIRAQAGQASGNTDGGAVAIQGGDHNGTGLRGGVQLGLGPSVVMFEVREIAPNKYITTLNVLVSPTTANTGTDPGALTTYMNNRLAAPTTNPVDGVLLFAASGGFKHLRSNGILVN